MSHPIAHNGSETDSGVPQSTSTSLLQRVKAHDADGWQRLVDLYGPQIYRWCRQCGLQAVDAADVGQEVFKAVAMHVGDFRRERPGDSFRGWLWTITHNKIRDHLKSRRGKPEAEGGTAAQLRFEEIPEQLSDSSVTNVPGSEGNAVEHRVVELIQAGVEDRTWEAFWRVTVVGHPVSLVADELGMTSSAVYKAKYRVMRLLRSELSDLEGQ